MKRNILLYLLGGLFSFVFGFGFLHPNVYAQPTETGECKGIKLNTNFPGIGNCIEIKSGSETNPTTAFPKMMQTLTRIALSLGLVVCFILIIWAGIMRAGDKPKEGKDLMKKVAIAVLLLGFSGAILRLINPNFFG